MQKTVRIVSLIVLVLLISLIIQKPVQANSVEYRGEAEGIIINPDDFFLELGEFLPGDTKKDSVLIKNTTNDTIEVFFKTESIDRNEYYDDIDYSILEKFKLKISLKKTSDSEEEIIYEGNLGAETINEYISLGSYSKGFDGEFKFELEVPTELKNDYTLSTSKVKWVFAVEKTEEDFFDKVQTGDNIYLMFGILGIAIILNLTIIIFIKKRRDSNEK